MKAKEFIPVNKPRNFVAKNAMSTTSGAGSHRDKKKEQKRGYEKHKNRSVSEGDDLEIYGLRIGDTVTTKIDGQRVQGDIIDIFPDDMEVELLLRGPEAGKTVTVDVRDTEYGN